MLTTEQALMLNEIKNGYFNRLRRVAQIARSEYDDLSTKFSEDELPVQVCYYCEGGLEENFFVFREKGVVFAIAKDCLDYLVNHENEAIQAREKRVYTFYMSKQDRQN